MCATDFELMEQTFAAHCDQEFGWDPSRPLVVACSGGLDSVVLVHLMHSYHGNLILAHMNYGLRGQDSDKDQELVSALGADLGYEVVIKRVAPEDVKNQPRTSLQMKARELRYAFFEHVMLSHGAQGVLTAHHADDNLETFILNFSRGTGLKGLTGINSKTHRLFRPLLPFRRADILAYAHKKGYTWREDASNQSDDYQRNIIRHHISPGFNKLERAWDQSLAQTQDYLNQAQTLLEDYLEAVTSRVMTHSEDGLRLDLKVLATYPNAMLLLSSLCRKYGVNAGQDLGQLVKAQSGARIYTPTHQLLKDRDVILINALDGITNTLRNPESITINELNPQTLSSSEIQKTLSTGEIQSAAADQSNPDYWLINRENTSPDVPVEFNFESVDSMTPAGPDVIFVPTHLLVFPLKLRRWQIGDVFCPFGGPGKKKISKFFKDERLSLVRKNKIWLLECAGRIMWVVGLRADERFRVTDFGKGITKISWISKEP